MGKENREKEKTGELGRCPSHRWLEGTFVISSSTPNPHHTQYTNRAG